VGTCCFSSSKRWASKKGSPTWENPKKLAFERRKSGFRYFYVCLRRGGRVEKRYFGRGFAAEIAVELEAQKRERRRDEAAALKAERARLKAT
jgi:hypothetical protein